MQFDRELWNKITEGKGIIGEEECILCNYPNDDIDKKLLIKEFDYWIIIYNKFPYGGIKKHILLFPKRHIESAKDLNNYELLDLKNTHNFLYNFYEGKKYFSFLRETFDGRSIKHLHYHYMPGNVHGNEFTEILNKQGY